MHHLTLPLKLEFSTKYARYECIDPLPCYFKIGVLNRYVSQTRVIIITLAALERVVYTSTFLHYSDTIMDAMASKITRVAIVYATVYSGADQRKHQSSASLAFVREIHRWPVIFPHKGPVPRKMFPFDDVIMLIAVRTRQNIWPEQRLPKRAVLRQRP